MDFIQKMEWILEKEEAVYSQELIQFMLENIGITDSYIRDSLIYRTFSFLILNNQLSIKLRKDVLETCISSDYLFYNLNEKEEDAVFKRSFSALVIALFLYKDSERRVLEKNLVTKAISNSLAYLQLEYDYRGYVEGKGWAHAVAHGSDLLAICVQHPLFEITHEPLNILEKFLHSGYPFIDDEQSRMVPVIEALLEKGMSEIELIEWLATLNDIDMADPIQKYRIQWNVEKFSKELAWFCIKNEKHEEISSWILSKY